MYILILSLLSSFLVLVHKKQTTSLISYILFSWWNDNWNILAVKELGLANKTNNSWLILWYQVSSIQIWITTSNINFRGENLISGPVFFDHSWSFKQYAQRNWKNWQSCCLQFLLPHDSLIQNKGLELTFSLIFV